MIRFLARVKQVSVKNCADLSKTTRITLETEELVAGQLDQIAADSNVNVTVEKE